MEASRLRSALRSSTTLALIALIIGTAIGIAIALSGRSELRAAVNFLEPLGTLWVNAIRMTLVPLVVCLLITSINSFADTLALGRVGARMAVLFMALLIGTAVFAALAAPPLFAALHIDPDADAALRARATGAAGGALPTLRGFFISLVPTNPIAAAAEGAMLPLIVFTSLFALACTQLPQPLRHSITTFFRAAGDAMLIVVRWILVFTPVGVFALAVSLGADLGLTAAGAIGYYIVVISLLLLVGTLLLYPVAAAAGGISMRAFARACAPAQAVAAGTRSSLASLPALIAGSRDVFGDRPALTGFVLPVCVSTFKINTPISDLVGPLFLAALYGIPLSPLQIVTMTAVTVAMSFSNPGIPSGGLFVVTAPVMMSVGLPIEGIALLIAADAIPDIFATVINVTGDQAVAAAIAPHVPEASATQISPRSSWLRG